MMTQYENRKWVDYFRVIRKVVLQLTKNIKPLISKEIKNKNVQSWLELRLHAPFIIIIMEQIIYNAVKCL
jgi:hypothetical protein